MFIINLIIQRILNFVQVESSQLLEIIWWCQEYGWVSRTGLERAFRQYSEECAMTKMYWVVNKLSNYLTRF